MPFDTLKALGVDVREESQVVLPSGGDFAGGRGMIAPWHSMICHWFMTQDDIHQYNAEAELNNGPEPLPVPDISNKRGDWYHYYYRSYDSCVTAYYALDPNARENGYSPQERWVLYTTPGEVINRSAESIQKMKDGFGDQILFDLRVMKLSRGSGAYPLWDRHQYHMLALPAIVAALATASGLENAGFDLEDVLSVTDVDAWNDESFFALAGDPEGEYEDSTLFIRRAALWASLGEKDPKKDQVKGAKTAKGKPSSKATSSEALSECIGIVQYPWGKPIWCRVISATNPAGYNAKQPKIVPLVTEIFLTEAKARAAAAEELDAQGVDVQAQSLIPENWRDAADHEWYDYVRQNDDPSITATSMPPKKRQDLIELLYADNFEQIEAARAKNAG